MMCPDDGTVDHVGGGISLHHFGKRFEHGVKDAGRHPSPIAAKNAVPLAIFVRQVPPLRACPGDPHHPFEIQPVILRGPAAAATLSGQKSPDDRPFRVRYPYPLAQRCLQKSALNQAASPLSTFVHET